MASNTEDDMDSLFEGMVLFTPNSQQDPPTIDNSTTTTTIETQPTTTTIEAQSTTTKTTIETHSITITTSTSSEPLDEDLFSDLTLVTPTISSDPSPSALSTTSTPTVATPSTTAATSASSTPTATSATLTRQITKRKKKATIKIGYGRDESNSNSATVDSSSDDHHRQNHDPSLPPSDVDHCRPESLPAEVHHPDVKITSSKRDDDDNGGGGESDGLTSEKFEVIKAQISEKLASARDLVASVSTELKNSIRRRRKAAEEVNGASLRYSEIEKELEEACEAEDFERAERLSESLADAEKTKGELVNALRAAEGECDAVDAKMQQAIDLQIATEEECASLLDRFSTDAASDAQSVLREADTQSSKEMDDWLSSTEALQIKKIELEIESHLIDEARKAMDSSIEHSMEDDIKEKDLLYKKKDVLIDELEKLIALVKEKEKEIAENDCNIEVIEKRISDAVSGFQEAKSSIEAKYDNLQSGLSQMELESESLSMRKKEIDEFIIQAESNGAKLRELAKLSADEAKEYQEVIRLRKSLLTSIFKSREDKTRLAKTEEQLSDDVQQLQSKVSAARASLQELSSTKSSVQQNITSFQERIFSISKRVPELEAEKKVAATARNFKEAARISAEAKSLTVEKDGLQSDLEKALLQVEKLEEEIKETVNELEETERLILSKEKEVAMARFQKLLLVVGAATAERSAALELGFAEEANLYLAEAEAAQSEAMKLKEEYNFEEEEFASLPKHFISMELVSNLGKEQLASLAGSINVST